MGPRIPVLTLEHQLGPWNTRIYPGTSCRTLEHNVGPWNTSTRILEYQLKPWNTFMQYGTRNIRKGPGTPCIMNNNKNPGTPV